MMLRVFRRLLSLFPPGYRGQFGAEQLEVLEQAAAETALHGRGALAWLWLNELLSLPGAVLRAHLRERGMHMPELPANPFVEKPAGRWAALLAGLPHLLYALALYLPVFIPLLVPPRLAGALERWAALLKSFAPSWWALQTLAAPFHWLPSRVYYQTFQWVFALLILLGILAAWRRAWPLWSATWLGYLLVVLFNGLITLFPDGRVAYPKGFLWVALALWIYIRQARRSLLGGLLAVLPFSHMFIWYLGVDGIKGTYPEALGYILAGLLLMLAVAAAMRSGRLTTALGLILGVTLLVGAAVAYGTVYHSNMPVPPAPTPLRVALQTLTGLPAFALLASPFWLTLLWRWRSRRLAR